MAFKKVVFTLLLMVLGSIILNGNMKTADAKICPQICFDAAYMTCPSSGHKHLTPKCNCCLASKGCTIYNADGTPICTAT